MQARLIVDGSVKDHKTLASPRLLVPRARPTYIGAMGGGQGVDPWDGQLYDVRLWSGARQAATIRKFASVLPARCNAFLGPSSPPCYAVVNRGKQRFPSLRINAPLRCEGKAYFEATIRSSGCIQVRRRPP